MFSHGLYYSNRKLTQKLVLGVKYCCDWLDHIIFRGGLWWHMNFGLLHRLLFDVLGDHNVKNNEDNGGLSL